MKKNKYFNAFLSCLLTLCMALSCATAAFADTIDANGITVNQNLGDITVAVTGTTNGVGLEITAEDGGVANVTAGSVAMQSEDGVASAVSVMGYGNDTSVTLTVGNSVTADSDSNYAHGVSTHGRMGNVEVTVDGDVSATGGKFASGVGSDEGLVCSVTVEGNVTAAAEGNTMGISAGRSEDLTVTVTGNVSADSVTGRADGINVLNDVIDGLHSTVNVTGEVKAESDSGVAFGVYIHGENDAESHVITGDITAASGTNDATGIMVQSTMAKDTDVTVNGDLTVTSGTDATGAIISDSANTDITINGNVDVSGDASTSMYHVSSFPSACPGTAPWSGRSSSPPAKPATAAHRTASTGQTISPRHTIA